MSWEAWIDRQEMAFRNMDDILDFIVNRLNINKKTRKTEITDMRHYLVNWFIKNKPQFKKYNNNTKFAKCIGIYDHSSVTHYSTYRKKTHEFKKNVKPIVEILEKAYICK